MAPDTDMAAELVIAEAAAWLARLQGDERTHATEVAFKEWLADPAHAHAFSRVTDTWEIIPGAAIFRSQRKPVSRRRTLVPALLAAGAVLVVCTAGGSAFLTRDPVYATTVGQQQTVTLSDGTRVALNTDSKLVVDYSRDVRRVRLDRGEAMFEVTKNPHRPFIVQAGEESVRALGTTFTVRRDDGGKLAVVLIEGRVEITRRAPAQPRPTKVATLSPGERLTVRPDAGMAVDRPKVETATAWRRGEVMFDDSSLIDAVAELNRYGQTQVVVGDPGLASLRVSGVFETGDPVEFAQTVAQLHHLRVDRSGDSLVLRR